MSRHGFYNEVCRVIKLKDEGSLILEDMWKCEIDPNHTDLQVLSLISGSPKWLEIEGFSNFCLCVVLCLSGCVSK